MDPEVADGSDAGRISHVRVPVEARVPGGSTNAYLVRSAAGTLLVDPAARTSALDDAIAAVEAAGNPVDAVAVTHTHTDHVGAVATYAERTGATVHAHADHVDRFRAATGSDPDATFRDGDAIGGRDVIALDTPGHAPDHVAFVVPEGGGTGDVGSASDDPGARTVLVGDLAFATGSVAVAVPDGDLSAYLASLERVRDLDAARLYPGHGPPIDDPSATCDRLVRHRLDRERRVLAAIEGGAGDVDAVVDAAYDKDLTGVEALARGTVVAHVDKLVADGSVDRSWSRR